LELANRYVEHAVQLPGHNPTIAHALAFLSLAVHGQEAGSAPIAAGHRVQTAPGVIPFPYDWVALDSLEPLHLGGGEPVSLYQPLFMTEDERKQVQLDGLPRWIEEKRAAALQRWLHPGSSLPLTAL